MARFLVTLLIIIAAWYLIGFIGRLLFPYLMTRLSKKIMNNFTGGQNINFNEEKKKEGEVSIKQGNKEKKEKDNGEGEYVDFEEIE